jgi:hypothetical protein
MLIFRSSENYDFSALVESDPYQELRSHLWRIVLGFWGHFLPYYCDGIARHRGVAEGQEGL